jgi:hypothetical protein
MKTHLYALALIALAFTPLSKTEQPTEINGHPFVQR